jgi:D-amino peptidase
MKIFISADIEGVAGVTNFAQIFPEGGGAYAAACHLLTAEVNAAIEGALEAGAKEIVVADSHSQATNIIPTELHPEAQLVRGQPRPHCMMQGLEQDFEAALLVGYHSMAGTPRGVLAHTFIADISEIRLNGKAVGEVGFNAAFAGELGVPVAVVTGDDTLAAEIQDTLPWAERVITKWGLSPFAARNLSPQKSQAAIRQAAKRALGRLNEMKPYTAAKPVKFEIDFGKPHLAPTLSADIPGVESDGWETLTYTAKDMADAMRMLRLILNLNSAVTKRPNVGWLA